MSKRAFLLVTTAVTIFFIAIPFLKAKEEIPMPDPIIAEEDTMVFRPQPRSAPTLMVRKKQNETQTEPLELSRLKIDVKVIGNMAVTTMDMTFRNNLDRVLDGEFTFPLGEGQSVSGYSLEVQGNLRPGVVVEKAKGRQVYEKVVRRKVDPGLMEWTAGNNFRTRIYPIPANGTKQVVVSYEQELAGNKSKFVYMQPMLFKEKIHELELRAEVVKQQIKPQTGQNALVTLEFDSWNDSWVAQKKLTDVTADKPLVFEIPRPANTAACYTELKSREDNTSYFYCNIDPKLFTREKKQPAKIVLLWDVSGSAKNRDAARELKLLDTYIAKLGTVEIEFVPFSINVHSRTTHKIVNGKWDALRRSIETQTIDGATQFGSLNLASFVCDEFLLVSDGLSNFGDPDIKLSRTPVNVVASSQTADHSHLKYIAQASGGQFINLQATADEQVVARLYTAPYRFLFAEFEKSKVSEVYPSIPTTFDRNFSVTGLLKGEKAIMWLHFGFGNQTVYTTSVEISAGQQTDDGIVKRAWAQKKINELDIHYVRNKDAITDIGKAYSIVTRNTSLLVLDDINDYFEHRVEPPTAEMKKKYFEMLAAVKDQNNVSNSEHIESVVNAFQKRQVWYKTVPAKKQSLKMTESVRFTEPSIAADAVEISVQDSMTTGMAPSAPHAESAHYNITLQADIVEGEASKNMEEVQISSGSFNLTSNGATSFNWDGKKNKDLDVASSEGADIELKPWDSNEPYIIELKKVPTNQWYALYLKLKETNGNQPSFYIDVADLFAKVGMKQQALRILSNLAELYDENHEVLRVLAHRLQQLHENELAVWTFKTVLRIREEEPQSYRDLGLALADCKKYQQAVDVLSKVVNRKWDERFPEIEALAACEINHIIAQSGMQLRLDSLDKRLVMNMPVDIRIVINWDTNDCDMDLWVTDPSGETCKYDHAETEAGGLISHDFTGGYGPEEFMIRRGQKGKYKIQVNYYGTREQSVIGPTTVQATLYTNYGRPGEKKKEITLRLSENKEVVEIGNLLF